MTTGENPFLPEVQAANPHWKRTRRRTRNHERALRLLEKAEKEMRGAFKRWEKYRAQVERLEKSMDRE